VAQHGSLQHLERGETRPRRITAQHLAVALALPGAERRAFEAMSQPVPRRRTKGQDTLLSAAAREDGRSSAAPAQTAPMPNGDGSAVRPAPLVALSRSPDGAHNLPAQLTSFIGREQEIAAVTRLLGSARLVTLTGAGGCGKTRLALHVAVGRLDRYAQGVWLVEWRPCPIPRSCR